MSIMHRHIVQDNLCEEERLAWLRLIRTENIGPITFYQLLERFGTARDALAALPDLSKRGGRKKPLNPPSESNVAREYDALQRLGGKIITPCDKAYPLALGATDDAPPVLSIIGDETLLNKSCVAIVGARNASVNGKKFTSKLASDLGARGQIVVSGLARGIDTAAHHGALNAGTISVVAGGIDVVYPEENQGLYEQIKEKGLVVAESPLGSKPFAASFPRRNRIVSGISKAVIVVEATQRSGSLITARLAGEQGRDVMAVPGSPLDPRSSGPNHLIREGATLIRSADDVLESLLNFSGTALRDPHMNIVNFTPPAEPDIFAIDDENYPEDRQDIILSHLSFSAISVDELIRACHLTISGVQTTLLELELAGRIKRLPGNRVCLQQETDN